MPALQVLSRCNDLIAQEVITSDGRSAGEIADIVIEPQSGRVAYAVVLLNSASGDDQSVLIPWSSMKIDGEGQALRLQTTWESVARAPRMDHGQIPSRAEREWEHRVHRHFDAVPYWDGVDLSVN